MVDYDGMSPGQVLADASVAEFIKNLGLGIAEAQKALDDNSVEQIAEFIEPREGLGGKTLLDLGLSPAFYHYQHADLTCSLQLSLRVEKDLSLGLNLSGSLNDTSTSSDDSSSSETSTESGTSTRSETRQASLEVTSASAGTLNVGGQPFALTGATPGERIRNLQGALTGNSSSGIARVLYQLRPSTLTITTDAAPEKVQVTANTVAFLSGGFDRAFVRVGTDTDTTYNLDNDPAAVVSNTTAQGSLAAYATHVELDIRAQGYNTLDIAPGEPISTIKFETGEHTVPAANQASVSNNLMNIAQAMRQMNFPITIEGFTDRQRYANRARSDELNRQLGDNRAREIQNILIANGAPPGLITMTPSRGEAEAETAGDSEGQDNEDFRKVDIKTPGRTHHWILVQGRSGGPNLEAVTPNMVGNSSDDNGFIYLYKPTALGLSGKKVTIETIDFPLRGAAVAGFASGDPEAYAKNLADDINANGSANLQATNAGNVVTVTKDGDSFNLTLVTAEQREISLSGTSGITVTTQFSRTRSSSQTRQNTGNRTVAVGASLDVRYSRQFEMNVTGNSSISARLVSIPAPPQFLETIRDFLNQDD